MTISRTFDYALIREVMTHPQVWPHITDDGSPAVEDFRVAETDQIYYVLAQDGEEVIGVWMLVPQNAICWGVHTCILPSAWGERARRAALVAVSHVWENTPCLRLTTVVPEYNRLALRFAKQTGFAEWGREPQSILKGGKLFDQIHLGLSKGEPCQQQQ